LRILRKSVYPASCERQKTFQQLAGITIQTGHFAETAIVGYRLLVADPGKNKFRFLFPFAANKQKFAVSIFCWQQMNGIAVFH
jgi:hypothetical protein